MDARTVRLRMGLAYDGAPFRGWARQPGLPSVQAAVEDALELVFRHPCTTVVAGRTDTGVHARRQTVHVDVGEQAWQRLAGTHAPEHAAVRKLNGALRRVLGRDRAELGWEPVVGAVVVNDVAVADPGFDARFSALSRGYTYRICDAVTGHDPLTRSHAWWLDAELDVAAMDEAVRELLGLQDFLSYCKPREGATTVRELQRASVRRDEHGVMTVSLTADAFCHHMVRSIVGAAVRVGEGRQPVGWPGERLWARERDASVVMAPAHGLVLESVQYPGPEGLRERAELTRARRATS